MISHRDRLFKKKKEDPLNQHIKHSYNLFRNRTTREIKKSRRKYYKEYFEGNLNNMKKTWQGIKQIININNKAGVQINQPKGSKLIQIKKWPILLMSSLQKLAPN